NVVVDLVGIDNAAAVPVCCAFQSLDQVVSEGAMPAPPVSGLIGFFVAAGCRKDEIGFRDIGILTNDSLEVIVDLHDFKIARGARLFADASALAGVRDQD